MNSESFSFTFSSMFAKYFIWTSSALAAASSPGTKGKAESKRKFNQWVIQRLTGERRHRLPNKQKAEWEEEKQSQYIIYSNTFTQGSVYLLRQARQLPCETGWGRVNKPEPTWKVLFLEAYIRESARYYELKASSFTKRDINDSSCLQFDVMLIHHKAAWRRFVWLLAGLCKNCKADFYQTCWSGAAWASDEPFIFRGGSI